ncbi:ATP-binding protein [Chryseolinea sp. T2]|uniref:sensor histidine kinase n=1 Tax=Chryseolinea sp. T2 TaxID=3129255 RepID=UPI0030777AE1
MQFLHKLVNTGVNYPSTSSAQRGLQLANAIATIFFLLSLIVAFMYYIWYGWYPLTWLIPLTGFSAFVIILFNNQGWIYVSRVWLSIGPAILVTSLSIYSKRLYYDQQAELDYFTFRMVILASCVIPWVVFSLHERIALISSSLLGLMILMLHDPLHFLFDVPYQQDKLRVFNYYFTNVVVFIAFGIITASLGFLRYISDKHEDRNVELIEDLALANRILMERNSEIEAQSVEIQAQSDLVHESQSQLIEANRLIDEQRKQLFSRNQSLESELIEKNAKLTDTNSELIKHNNELRQFSYTVSHNLRGPVASLLGLINLIDTRRVHDADKDIFSHLMTATRQLDQIIKDLSKIIDIRHDIFRIRQRIDLGGEVHDIAQVLRKDIEEQHVEIITNLQGCTHIYSVKPMVSSILYNLISNAIRYRSNERNPVIQITSHENDDYYFLEIEDNGLGIDLHHNKDHLFRLYKRFHFHTEGKGLGLYLVKLQCESLSGVIDVESEVNRFTRFKIKFRKPANIERQILYQEAHAEIFYDAKINVTGVVWLRPVSSEEYRSVFRKCLEFVRTYNTPNYLSDMTRQGNIDHDDQRWMMESIMPHAIKNGLKRIATVLGDTKQPLVREYNLLLNEEIHAMGAEYQFFATGHDAYEWLRQENERAAIVSLL